MTTKRRPLQMFWILGLAVLLATAIGAGVVLNPTRAGDNAANDNDPAASVYDVVCLGHVDVEEGVTPLNPARPGKVEQVQAKENKFYRKGEVLFTMDKEAAALRLEEAQKDIALAREQMDQARRKPVQELKDKIALQELAVPIAQKQLEAAEAALKYTENLAKSGFGNAQARMGAKAMVSQREKTLLLEKKKLEQLREQVTRDALDQFKLAQKVVEAKAIQVRQAEQVLRQCDVKAPVDGKVLRVLVSQGEVVGAAPTKAALLFLPTDKERIIRAEIDQEYVSRVAEGDFALIEDDTRPENSHHWEGKVVRMSDWYTQRRSILQEPLHFNDVRTLECIVRVVNNPGKQPLRIGQRVRVKIKKSR